MTCCDRKSLHYIQSSPMDFLTFYFQLACTYFSLPADPYISIAEIKKT